MKPKKLGRKPVADKKVMLRIFVEQSTVDLNGGQDACKQECYLFLKERGQKLKKKSEPTKLSTKHKCSIVANAPQICDGRDF